MCNCSLPPRPGLSRPGNAGARPNARARGWAATCAVTASRVAASGGASDARNEGSYSEVPRADPLASARSVSPALEGGVSGRTAMDRRRRVCGERDELGDDTVECSVGSPDSMPIDRSFAAISGSTPSPWYPPTFRLLRSRASRAVFSAKDMPDFMDDTRPPCMASEPNPSSCALDE